MQNPPDVPAEHAEAVKDLTFAFQEAIRKHYGVVVNINEISVACITTLVCYLVQIEGREARQEYTAKMIGIIIHMVAKGSI